MKRVAHGVCAVTIALNAAACGLGWKHRGGALVLPASHSHVSRSGDAAADADSAGPPAAGKANPPHRISLTLPEGWNWVMRGDDLLATRDGVFLQNIVVERIHVGQALQSSGAFPLAALSSKEWPVRTVKRMKRRFAPGMSPTEAAEVLLDSRGNDPAVTGLDIREVTTRAIAGNPAFEAVFEFRLKYPAHMPAYRSVYCGFMREEWFYGIEYTAALRHYFRKDVDTFESVLRSLTLAER